MNTLHHRHWSHVTPGERHHLRALLIARDGERCAECRRAWRPGLPITIDHVIPRSAGGTNDPDNLRLLCEPCNTAKGGNVTVVELEIVASRKRARRVAS